MKKILSACAACIIGFAVMLAAPGPAAAAQDSGLITGKVVETMDSSGYTYVCVEKAGKKTWLAVPQTKVIKGKTMSFKPGTEMVNFESKTLKRTFPSIIFSDGVADGKASSAKDPHAGSKAAAAPAGEKISVEKAAGANAYTVAEVYAKKKTLSKKQVLVKGKVVKFNSGIMGKNWIHLQDGSGDASKGTHNLVVTTADTAAVGDVVTISGPLSVDKDFGMGYRYDLIVEGAKVTK